MTKRAALNDVLPLGTVVTLKDERSLDYMIISRGVLLEDENFKDYGAVLLPIGLSKDGYRLFDVSDIERVKFQGYVNRAESEFGAKFKIWRNDFTARIDDVKTNRPE